MDPRNYLNEYVRITLASIKSPGVFFREMKGEGVNYLKPLAYMFISAIVYLVGAFSGFILTPQLSGYPASKTIPALAFILKYIIISIPFLAITIMAIIVFQIILMHLAVRLVGGKGNLYDIFRVFCYSYSPMNVAWLFSLFSLPMLYIISLKVVPGTLIAALFLLSALGSTLYTYYIVIEGISVTSEITRLRAFAAVVILIIIFVAIIFIALFGIALLYAYTSEYSYSYSAKPYDRAVIDKTTIGPTVQESRRYDITVYPGSSPVIDGIVDERDAWYEGEQIDLESGGKNYTITTKHDYKDLFILMRWGGTSEWNDAMRIYFEQDGKVPDHNLSTGLTDNYYQGSSSYGPESYRDAHFYSGYTVQEHQDGTLKAGFRDQTWILEWKIPLQSGDIYDININEYPIQLGFYIANWGMGAARGILPPHGNPYEPETWGNMTIIDKKRAK